MSDATIVAPSILTAQFHSKSATSNTYFFYFNQSNQAHYNHYHSQAKQFISPEDELEFIFGEAIMAQINSPFFADNLSDQPDYNLSIKLIKYWSDFAKNG